MVTISIFIEGDKPENSFFDNISGYRKAMFNAVMPQNNFREAFNILFTQAITNESEIKIETLSIGTKKISEENETILKMQLKTNEKSCLLIDLDQPESTRQEMILNNFSEFDTGRIFFMIQQMESWIISQPNIIIEYFDLFYKRINREVKIENHEYYFNNNFDEIEKTEDKLDKFIKHYWKEKNSNTKAKYHKTKIAPALIKKMILSELLIHFDDVRLIKDFINLR